MGVWPGAAGEVGSVLPREMRIELLMAGGADIGMAERDADVPYVGTKKRYGSMNRTFVQDLWTDPLAFALQVVASARPL